MAQQMEVRITWRRGKGGAEKGEGQKEDLFDDPKYVSSSWVKNEVTKAQVSGREI